MSKSILSNEKVCYVCGTPLNLHRHHVYAGVANRKKSEKYGCWCYLCAYHHNMSNYAVHFNKQLDDRLKERCQIKFEEIYGHDNFIKTFNKNYIK